MTVGELREASVSQGHRIRRFLGGRAALWLAFAIVHGALVWLNLTARGDPLGDVTAVYRVWAENAAAGYVRMGIDASWVYPILAFAPMAGSLAFGSEWYGQTWLAIVVLLDAAAFAILLGDRRLSRTRRIAAWWWVGFLALLGPIALGRIDAITVPLAITGLLWAAGRPRVAADPPDHRRMGEGVAGRVARVRRDRLAQAMGRGHRRRRAQRGDPRRQPARGRGSELVRIRRGSRRVAASRSRRPSPSRGCGRSSPDRRP